MFLLIHHLFKPNFLFKTKRVDLMHHLSNFLVFDIPLLYYYINLKISIICCLSCGDIDLSLGISLLTSFDDNSFEWNSFRDFFECSSVETLVISSAILLPIKYPVVSTVSLIALLEAVLLHLLQSF